MSVELGLWYLSSVAGHQGLSVYVCVVRWWSVVSLKAIYSGLASYKGLQIYPFSVPSLELIHLVAEKTGKTERR